MVPPAPRQQAQQFTAHCFTSCLTESCEYNVKLCRRKLKQLNAELAKVHRDHVHLCFFLLHYLTVTLSVTPLCLRVITDREGQKKRLDSCRCVGEIYPKANLTLYNPRPCDELLTSPTPQQSEHNMHTFRQHARRIVRRFSSTYSVLVTPSPTRRLILQIRLLKIKPA